MDFCSVVSAQLEHLGFEQKDLAAAVEVTESYISQLLTRKKLPPAPDRTDIYEKMGGFLKVSSGKLAKLAELQRREALRTGFQDAPAPLFPDVRELVLRKCTSEKRGEIRAIFEKQPFGELERLVTQKLLDVIKQVAREESKNEKWLGSMARFDGRSHKQIRAMVLGLLGTEVLHVSLEKCASLVDPLVDFWDIDLPTFAINIVLDQRLAPGDPKRFEFVEREAGRPSGDEPGLSAFLEDDSLSGNATPEEIEFLKRLRFDDKQPTPLYYYRELQNLRDPLHFSALNPQARRFSGGRNSSGTRPTRSSGSPAP